MTVQKRAGQKRVLYLSSVPLVDATGGSVVMYNHLKRHHDFKVLEINNELIQAAESCLWHPVANAFYGRVNRTRWCHLARGYEQLRRYQTLPRALLKTVREFEPDVILTVAHGNLFWLAYKVARQLGRPLVSIYHDWWPLLLRQGLLQQGYSLSPKDSEEVSRRFQQLYRESDCALCISEGMREALGDRTHPHPNAHILSPMASCQLTPSHPISTPEHFKVLYSGNVVASYGQQLRSLIDTQPANDSLKLVIHGNPHDWAAQETNKAIDKGILKPFIPTSQMDAALSQASALLTVISFDPNLAQLMSTNFPSKLATYATFQKPLIVWSPAYSTAAKFVRQHDCALLIEDPDPKAAWQAIEELSKNMPFQQQLADKALQIHRDVLHPDPIHQAFVRHIQAVCHAKGTSQGLLSGQPGS